MNPAERKAVVPPHKDRARLDRFLAAALPELSRARVQALARAGAVQLDGLVVAKPGATVRAGQTLTVHIPPVVPPDKIAAEDLPLMILYEDTDLAVINKPAGMVTHPGAGNHSGTLVNALLHHCRDWSGIGGQERPGIVHRLDKETSGCLVVAKHDRAHRALARQFAGRTVEKIYLAIIRGVPKHQQGVMDAPIGRHPVRRKQMTVRGGIGARSAITAYRVLLAEKDKALVECRPQTGRTHQIRAHLKHLGHPILGDPVYGQRAGFPRHLLHAWRLAFDHPATTKRMTFTAPVPEDFPLVPPAEPGHNTPHA